jgi:hypothetical protein
MILSRSVHTSGEFSFHVHLADLLKGCPDRLIRWNLRTLDWRLEERERLNESTCARHTDQRGKQNTINPREEMRTIAHGSLANG